MFQKLIARQLAKPSGLVGRRLTARWLNKANARMNQLTLNLLAIETHDKVLEVGFGGGDLLERILSSATPQFVAGVDLSADMVQRMSVQLQRYLREGKLELRCADIEDIPFPAEKFTKVCTVNTIYFWQNPAAALGECRRVLQVGGQILICFNSREDLESWPIHKHGFRLYEVDEVEALLLASGFDNVQLNSANDANQGTYHCVAAVAV